MNKANIQPDSIMSSPKRPTRRLAAKLYPNGECVVYQPRLFTPEGVKPYEDTEERIEQMRLFGMICRNQELIDYAPLLLGLSLHPIFDKNSETASEGEVVGVKARARKGQGGITSYGARMVRNAAYLLERDAGPGRSIFATVTVPSCPKEKLWMIHESWGKVVELYRLGLRRMLQDKGLSGEIVTVSEIQEKRYQKTGLPILHLHSVFMGVTASGKFAISTKDHDRLWFSALNAAVNIEGSDVSYACNLQRVKKSASGYLAKYLTKGSKSVIAAVNDGFAGWMPKHWWNCSRSLVARVKAETRQADEFSDWLQGVADLEGQKVWKWHRDVSVELHDGTEFKVARFGQLHIGAMAQIQAYYKSISALSG